MNSKFVLFLALLLTTQIAFLHSQEQTGQRIIEDASTVYVIREIDFDVQGRSRPFALIYHGEFKYGERIIGRQNLDRYLALKRQLLIDQRVLEEVRIEYLLGEREADGALPVRLQIYVRDTWNFIVLPYPEYNSNDGFSLTLKARHYNFLGTMSPLRVDLGYSQNDGEHEFNFMIESHTPFYFAGHKWNFRFDHDLSYILDEPLYYRNVTGLSVRLPWQETVITVGFNQFLIVNEENSDRDIEMFDLPDRFDGVYASTELFTSMQIPLGLEISDFGQLRYTPRLSGRINYPYNLMDDSRKPVTTFSHSLGFGRVHWIGNFRRGLSASISNSNSWYFDRDDAPLRIDLSCDLSFYWPLTSFMGFSSRLNYRQWWHWSDRIGDYIPHFTSGDKIRGVINRDIRAFQILTLNLDFPIRVLRFWPSEWFDNQRLRLFDFEMQFSPFTDLALFQGPYNRLKDRRNPYDTTTTFSLDDMINTAGLEVYVHPGFFRALKIRGSVGYNLRRIRDDGLSLRWGFFPAWDEIFIGLNFHY